MLFQMIEILFVLFIESSNGELRIIIIISSLSQNSSYFHCFGTTNLRLNTQLLFKFSDQQLFYYFWPIQTYPKDKEK
jgi:hypothetical protein